MKVVVLLSGGLDSATVLGIAKSAGYDIYALSFRYGQRHSAELAMAERLAAVANVKQHVIADINLRMFGGSALTDDIDVPKGGIVPGIPVTYVPARNTIFLAFGLAWAEALNAQRIFIGVNALDYSGYPDCRPEYIEAYQRMANLATKSGRVVIEAPLIGMNKRDIISLGLRLGADYSITSSCYDPAPEGACGQCDSCRIRLKGFEGSGVTDPIAYR
jgi:7-cyano-7-deazaguanine synthase